MCRYLTTLTFLAACLWTSLGAHALTLPLNTWVARPSPAYPSSPGAPAKHVETTYDSTRHVIYLWGGDYDTPDGRVDSHEDFWQYDVASNTWTALLSRTQAIVSGYPRGVCVAVFVYDPSRHLVWMTGGEQRAEKPETDHCSYPTNMNCYPSVLVSGGIWAFDPAQKVWKQKGPGSGDLPPFTTHFSTPNNEQNAGQYNAVTDTLIVPSSNGGSGNYTALYALTGITFADAMQHDNWSIDPSAVPTQGPLYEQERFAIDTTRRQAIFYEPYTHQTMKYDLTTGAWTQISTQQLPMKDQFGMAYVASQDVVAIFGGFDNYQGSTPDPNPVNDLWILNLATCTTKCTWTKPTLAGTISPRHGYNLVYDSYNDALMLFGGTGGWQNPGTIDSYGYDGTEVFLLRLNLGGGGGDTLAPAPPTNLQAQ